MKYQSTIAKNWLHEKEFYLRSMVLNCGIPYLTLQSQLHNSPAAFKKGLEDLDFDVLLSYW